MTVALYYEDAYLTEFEAGVVAVLGDRVCLDRTAFYPGGGGQPADTGVLPVEGAGGEGGRPDQGGCRHLASSGGSAADHRRHRDGPRRQGSAASAHAHAHGHAYPVRRDLARP